MNEPSEDDVEETPVAILATVADLATWMPEGIAKIYGDRPVWFLLEMDADSVTVFEQLPEDPMPKGKVEAILSGLRRFAGERADELQALLGPSDGISFGFHVDAKLDRVVDAFENDGFFVLKSIRDGEIRIESDGDEAAVTP